MLRLKFILFILLFLIGSEILYAQQPYRLRKDVRIPVKDDLSLSANIVLPAGVTQGSVIFVMDCYATEDEPTGLYRLMAGTGFILVHVYNRGKAKSDGEFVPFVNDAADNYQVIDWISKQPWCNGNIAMGGGSYLGFTQWAATKKLHPSLKAIVPLAAAAPGIDFINIHQIFSAYSLRWLNYVTNNKYVDGLLFEDNTHWYPLYNKLYKQGVAFNKLDSLDNNKKEIFQEWLKHPGFDSYWSNTMPTTKSEYEKITIPILSVTGYFDANQRGAMYYYNNHMKYGTAEGIKNHYLLIGPYTHYGVQNQPDSIVGGIKIDKDALYNMRRLTIEWFNHTLRGMNRPSIIKNNVNCFVLGSGWKHAASLRELVKDTTVLYLQTSKDTFKNLTLSTPGNKIQSAEINFDPASIKDSIEIAEIKPTLDMKMLSPPSEDYVNGTQQLMFESLPLEKDFEFIGSPIADLYFKFQGLKDCDISVAFYEVGADGKSIPMSSQNQRLSYGTDASKRNLLNANTTYRFTFSDTYFFAKKIPAGSKVRFIVKVLNAPGSQKNYGSGKDVSLETNKDVTPGTISILMSKKYPSSISLPGIRVN